MRKSRDDASETLI